MVNSSTLAATVEQSETCSDGSVRKSHTSPPMKAAVPAKKPIRLRCIRLMRCMMATAMMAVSVATVVVSRMGRKTSAGFAAPYCARYIIIVIGTTVRPEAFRLRNMIMASLAVSLRGFSSWSCCMARRPMGVAALSRPSMLAEMFMKMDPAAG